MRKSRKKAEETVTIKVHLEKTTFYNITLLISLSLNVLIACLLLHVS